MVGSRRGLSALTQQLQSSLSFGPFLVFRWRSLGFSPIFLTRGSAILFQPTTSIGMGKPDWTYTPSWQESSPCTAAGVYVLPRAPRRCPLAGGGIKDLPTRGSTTYSLRSAHHPHHSRPSSPHHCRSPYILRNRSSREGVMGVVPAEMSSGNGDVAAFPYALCLCLRSEPSL